MGEGTWEDKDGNSVGRSTGTWRSVLRTLSPLHISCVLSVPMPFNGDYIGLQGNPKLQKLKGGEEGPILVAETVKKVNRSNGKVEACTLASPQSNPELWGLQREG